MPHETFFIIESGNGYLVKIQNGTPEMITDAVSATRFKNIDRAEFYLSQLNQLGFDGRIIPGIHGKINTIYDGDKTMSTDGQKNDYTSITAKSFSKARPTG